MSTTATPTATQQSPPGRRQPFVTILVPCLNERLVIGEFVDWCFEGLAAAGAAGEVLIVDSSTDDSPQTAEAHGAACSASPSAGWARRTSTRYRTRKATSSSSATAT